MKKIISLGYNCETSFQMEKYFGSIDSSLFSWAFILNDERFLSALENVDDVFVNGIHFHMPSDDMFYDEKYDITFHGRTHKSVMFDEEGILINQTAYDESLSELSSRLAHLKEKLNADFVSNDDKIFIRKLEMPKGSDGLPDYPSARNYISQLDRVLANTVVGGSYCLFLVIEKEHAVPMICDMESDHVFLRTVDYFAPISDTKDGADYESWKRIFEEIKSIGDKSSGKVKTFLSKLRKRLKK